MGKFMNKLTATDVAEALTYLGSSSQDNIGVMRITNWSDDDLAQKQEISEYFAPNKERHQSCDVTRLDGAGIPTGNYLYSYDEELYDPRVHKPFLCSIKASLHYPCSGTLFTVYMYFLGDNG